ncbi:hypothetical protein T11_6828 [Trichinella zimbabwensis]|uniref:Uncharacterized protein n=1 Tax=Trichinella zimbabwensis TaxID=268475 RepID=A0A0V1E7U0_9BILA|nr:hypothetical protein T11_6828 [Trichinella zimbabwensis]
MCCIGLCQIFFASFVTSDKLLLGVDVCVKTAARDD